MRPSKKPPRPHLRFQNSGHQRVHSTSFNLLSEMFSRTKSLTIAIYSSMGVIGTVCGGQVHCGTVIFIS
jgi:hypothetical protein